MRYDLYMNTQYLNKIFVVLGFQAAIALLTGCDTTATPTINVIEPASAAATPTPTVTASAPTATPSPTPSPTPSTTPTPTPIPTHAAPQGHGLYFLLATGETWFVPTLYKNNMLNGLNSVDADVLTPYGCYNEQTNSFFPCYSAITRDVWAKNETLPPGIEEQLAAHNTTVTCVGYSNLPGDLRTVRYNINTGTGSDLIYFDNHLENRSINHPYKLGRSGLDFVSIACQ